MKLPNGYGSVVKLSGKEEILILYERPMAGTSTKKRINKLRIYHYRYAPTRADGLQMLADYNKNPFDTKAAKMTFDDVYEEWSKANTLTVSESNVKATQPLIRHVAVYIIRYSRI